MDNDLHIQHDLPVPVMARIDRHIAVIGRGPLEAYRVDCIKKFDGKAVTDIGCAIKAVDEYFYEFITGDEDDMLRHWMKMATYKSS